MLHSKHITLAANKTEAQSTFTRFKVNQGFITRAWISFPAGVQNLVNLRIFHDSHPFLPVDKNDFITGENITFEYPVMYEIRSEPAIIAVQAWNTDDTFAHTIDVQLLILPRELVLPVGAGEGLIAALRSLFERRGS